MSIAPQGVKITLERAAPQRSPLADAILRRQCTRAEYDGRPLPNDTLNALAQAAVQDGVRLLVLTERARIEGVLAYVTQANSAQMRDAAFVKELKAWIRFSDADALAAGDGLFARCTGNPAVPRWIGSPLFSLFFKQETENDKLARQLRSSAGVVVFSAERADPAHWIGVGRAVERFSLAATALGVRSAFVNQPVEVPMVRAQFGEWLGIGAQRPDLVVRFGHGPLLPYSLRRSVAQVSFSAA